ncbi:MAG: cytochrome P450 [Pseudomonadota bacterium]
MTQVSIAQPNIVSGTRSWSHYWNYINDPIRFFDDTARDKGNISVLGNPAPFGSRGRHHVVALGEEANRQVFTQVDTFVPGGQVLVGPNGTAQRRLRDGLLAMHGPRHRLHRKIMQPPFSRASVASYVPTMTGLIDQVCDRWVIGEPFDMYEEATTLSNWVAAHILFGHEDFDRSLKTCGLINRWIDLDVKARRLPLILDIPGTPCARLLRHAEVLEEEMRDLIDRKRNEKQPKEDVLSVLVQAAKYPHSHLREIDLIAHTVILHTAAFVTTASSLAWTMYLIAQNPKLAAQLDDEIKMHMTDWPPDPDVVEKMPLLDAVLRETLRLLPPVHHTIRKARHETDLQGVPMRKGDRVLLSAYRTHRDPEIFENPSQFDPTRWFKKKPGPYQYIPFSAGPRLCLGYQFAKLELKLMIIRIMQRFRLGVIANSHVNVECQLTLLPSAGIPMMVNEADGAFSANPVTGNINAIVKNERS